MYWEPPREEGGAAVRWFGCPFGVMRSERGDTMEMPRTMHELARMVALYNKGVMPFRGTVFEQPAFVGEAVGLWNAAENERMREEMAAQQAKSMMDTVRKRR